MFGQIVRVTMVLIAGSLLALALGFAGGHIVEAQNDTVGNQTANQQYASAMIDWFPAVVIFTAATILVGGAILRRGRVK